MINKLFLICSISLFLYCNDLQGKETGKSKVDEWECLYTSNNISHYERWIDVYDGFSTKERKCEFVVDCYIDSVFNFLINPQNTLQWMNGIRKVERVQTREGDKIYAYTIFQLPWPFKDMDMVALYEPFLFTDDHYFIQIENVKEMVQEDPKIKRVNQYHATWEIIKLDGIKTKVIFTVYSDTRPLVARFIQDPIVNKMFIKNFECLQNILSTLKSQTALVNIPENQ